MVVLLLYHGRQALPPARLALLRVGVPKVGLLVIGDVLGQVDDGLAALAFAADGHLRVLQLDQDLESFRVSDFDNEVGFVLQPEPLHMLP